ncbi:MAG: ABC transporter permease [Anaerolineae bacterium]|nr:ABC transporter permease [Anaerolineae bacterium]
MIRLSPRWRKVINDLWDNKPRMILVVLAIATGVLAFGSVFIARDQMLAKMNDQWNATHPPDIIYYMDDFDEEFVRSVTAMRNVEKAEGVAFMTVKLIADDDKEHELDIWAWKDNANIEYIRVNPLTGNWPPQRREIFLERSSAEELGASVGDIITLELSSGEQKELVMAGTVHDYFAEPPGLSNWLTSYTSMDTLRWMGHSGLYDDLRVGLVPEIDTMDEIEQAATELKGQFERDGYGVHYTDLDLQRHWGAETTEAVTGILAGIGFFSLGLSGFLVMNTISALITQQKRQIGMMKAIGASGQQVTGIYIAMVIIFGLLALAVAAPAGALLGYGMVYLVADFLNFDINSFGIPPWVFLVEALAAIALPLFAALIPIIGGTRVTVRQAISDYGIAAVRVKRGLLDRIVERVRGASRPIILSIRNTFRRKGRLFLTLGTLAIAGSIVIAVLNVQASMKAEAGMIMKLFQFDVEVIFDQGYSSRMVEREALAVDGVTSAETWTAISGQLMRPDGSEGTSFTVYGTPTESPFIDADIQEGRWLEPGDTNALVLSSTLRKMEPDVSIGDEIFMRVNGMRRRWKVVGFFTSLGEEQLAYATYDTVAHLEGSYGSSSVILVGTEQHDPDFQAQVATALEEHLKDRGVGIEYTITGTDIIEQDSSEIDFIVMFLLILAGLIAVVGALGLTGTMSLNVLERTREIGVMRAIGAGNAILRRIVVSEGVLIGVISWALALLAAIPMTMLAVNVVGEAVMGQPSMFVYSPLGVIAWLAVVVVISGLASLVPARAASRISVRESLAYE